MMEVSTDRGVVERSDPDAFWCSVCKTGKSKKKDGMLQVSNRDGSQLHSVCRAHVPKDHQEKRVDKVKHPVFHKTQKNDDGSPVVVGTGEHEVEPNADGVVRSLAYEDLK